MLDQYLEIFYTVCVTLVPLAIPVFTVYLLFYFLTSMLFDRR